MSDFIEQFIKNTGRSNVRPFKQTLHYIEQFGGNDLVVQNINPIWADDFKSYLLHKLFLLMQRQRSFSQASLSQIGFLDLWHILVDDLTDDIAESNQLTPCVKMKMNRIASSCFYR